VRGHGPFPLWVSASDNASCLPPCQPPWGPFSLGLPHFARPAAPPVVSSSQRAARDRHMDAGSDLLGAPRVVDPGAPGGARARVAANTAARLCARAPAPALPCRPAASLKNQHPPAFPAPKAITASVAAIAIVSEGFGAVKWCAIPSACLPRLPRRARLHLTNPFARAPPTPATLTPRDPALSHQTTPSSQVGALRHLPLHEDVDGLHRERGEGPLQHRY
jgi:hypothetical protein